MKRIIFIFLSLACFISIYAETYVVTASKLNVRAGTSKTAKVIGSLEKGFEVDIEEVTPGGYARFNYFGKEAYVKASYLKPKEQTEAIENNSSEESKVAVEETTSNESATVYVFYDFESPYQSLNFKINGTKTFEMAGNYLKDKFSIKYYSRNMTKINVKGEGKLALSYIYINGANEEFYNEIPLSIRDGETYYVRVFVSGIITGIRKKRNAWELEQLDAKKGEKLLKKYLFPKEKERNKYKINEEVDFTL